jgi:hypothetical protein
MCRCSYDSGWNNNYCKLCQLVQLEDCGRQNLRRETRSRCFGQWKGGVESWKQSLRKNRLLSAQSAQKRSAHSGTYVRFGERTQRSRENEYVPTGSSADHGAPGAAWIYRRHVSDYSRNLDAVPAPAASDIVVVCATHDPSARNYQYFNAPPERQSFVKR